MALVDKGQVNGHLLRLQRRTHSNDGSLARHRISRGCNALSTFFGSLTVAAKEMSKHNLGLPTSTWPAQVTNIPCQGGRLPRSAKPAVGLGSIDCPGRLSQRSPSFLLFPCFRAQTCLCAEQ